MSLEETGFSFKIFFRVVSYFPLIIIGLGVLGNISSFLVYTFHPAMNRYSSTVYLSFIAVFNTSGLFIWNLNHFLDANYDIWLESISLELCKFLSFVQYVSLQISGLLYSMISVDRYFTVISKPGSFVAKLPFGSRRSAYIWSFGIMFAVCAINIHVSLFNGIFINSEASDNQTNATRLDFICYAAENYDISTVATYIQVVVYSIVPFIIMSLFNTLLIKNVIYRKKNIKNKQSSKIEDKNFRLTLSLVILTIVFLTMTVPGTIANGLFWNELNVTLSGSAVSIILDCILFLQQTMIFFISCFTNRTFLTIVRNRFYAIFRRKLDEVSVTNKNSQTKS